MINLNAAFEHSKFIMKKPKVMIRIANGFFKRMILGKPVLRTIDLAITYKCNSRCIMCSAWKLMNSYQDQNILTVEEIDNMWKQAEKLGVIHVNLTGGEPLLRDIDEICKIIKNMEPDNFLISLVTNSLSVTREKIFKLKDAGLDTIQISLESLDAETNDKIRGIKGHRDKAMEALKYSKEAGLNICISCVLTRENFDDVERLADFSEKEGVFLLINPVSSSGAWDGQTEKKLTSDQLAKYNKLLEKHHIRADTIFNFHGKPGCPGGTERIHITSYGEVLTCPHVQVSYGNVKKEPLKKIWERMYSFEPLKKYSEVCKHAFDEEYYNDIIVPTENQPELPISIYDHPASEKYELKK